MGVCDMAKWDMKCEEKDIETETNFHERDMVNNPPHYNQDSIECIDAIASATADGFQFYLQGNIIKYLWRYRYKSDVQDLQKAKWYLDRLIQVRSDDC